MQHIAKFLLELGAGFAYVGRQVHLHVGEENFFLDLLLYHLKLRAYVVLELKAKKFTPEYVGQLGFYMTAVDTQVRGLRLRHERTAVMPVRIHRSGVPTFGRLLPHLRQSWSD